MRTYKYKAIFESIAKCPTDKEMDKHLAVASLAAVKSLLPKNIDYDRNYDLLGFAGNGAVINRANKNHHVIDSKTAVAINKDFAFKPMDLEHNRSNIVGVILNTGYTTYGSNEIMTEEEALACDGPFNIAIGGLVFRIVNPDFAELLENSSNPESLLHEAVSLSWEVGYNDYWINIGSPNLGEGETIKEPKQIEELSKFLRMNGGENQLEDGTKIYQYIYGNDVMPLAYGFTTRPAAQVKGVVTANEEIDKKNEKSKEIISHTTKQNVKGYSMKQITSLDQIFALSDTDLKEGNVSIASISDTIKNAIKKADETFAATLAEKESAAIIAKELNKTVKDLESKLDLISAAHAKEQAEASFNARMSLLDSEYDLSADDRKAIASDIAAITDDAGFETWMGKFSVYAAAKKKKAKPADDNQNDDDNDADDDTDDTDKKSKAAKDKKAEADDEEAVAAKKKKAKDDMKASIASAVEAAMKNAEEKGTVVNTNVATGKSYKEQYNGAFGIEGITLKK